MQLKQVFGFCLIAITSVVLCGCNGSGENGTTAERKFINLGTAPTGGAFHPVGCAAANVVTENKGDLNWVVTPQGTKGTQENIRRLESDELQFAMANAAISYFAVTAKGPGKNHTRSRASQPLRPTLVFSSRPNRAASTKFPT